MLCYGLYYCLCYGGGLLKKLPNTIINQLIKYSIITVIQTPHTITLSLHLNQSLLSPLFLLRLIIANFLASSKDIVKVPLPTTLMEGNLFF